jgi:imidazolonepropionase-like amidohydrolase
MTYKLTLYDQDDIAQLILIKHEFLSTNLVVYGGHGAPLVAKDLAAANISVILTGNRGAPDSWEKRNCLAGPPLSPSPAKILSEAGVLFALAVRGDSKIHGLAQEAGWAGAFAGLEEKEAIKLVSTNFERILRVDKEGGKSGEDERVYGGDFVIWNGNPLKGEGSVIAAVQDDGILGDCWPDSEGSVL